MQHYSRNLQSNQVVEDFLLRALNFDYRKSYKKIINMIVDAEMGVERFNLNSQTLSAIEMRSPKFRSEVDRWELRRQIIDELFTLKQLPNDDKIKIKKGGALPVANVLKKRQAFILIGLPASGKSTIASKISKDYGAVVIDSDYAKRKLPEYSNHSYGASLVHAESSAITLGFGDKNPNKLKSLYELCIEKNYNLVIPRIGQSPASIIDLTKALKLKKYDVHLILVSVSKREATIRAAKRYFDTKRYVPLGLIFDGYGNDPSLCYYYLRSKHAALFKSLGAITTLKRPPEHTDVIGRSPVSNFEYNDLTLQLI